MNRNPRPLRRIITATGAALLVLASTAACGGSGNGGTAGPATGKLKVTVVSGPLSDPFFGAMKAGTEQAAKDLGVDVTWTAAKDLSNVGPDYARLGDAAYEGHPDGVVLSYFMPPAQDPSLKKMLGDHIPVVFMNSGGDTWQDAGALNYVGEDPTTVGTEVGQRFIDAGKKDVICFNHAPGVPALQQRCDALKKVFTGAGLKFKEVDVPLTDAGNPTALGNALGGALRDDPSVDAVFTLGSSVAEVASQVIEKAGSNAELGTTDLSTNVLNLIEQGKIAFASDQQPYLTGYYSVQILAQYLRTGVHPIGAIDTAPNWITKDNVDQTIKINAANHGLRGAA
jgi:simple sugar transport system substrate-binding protein